MPLSNLNGNGEPYASFRDVRAVRDDMLRGFDESRSRDVLLQSALATLTNELAELRALVRPGVKQTNWTQVVITIAGSILGATLVVLIAGRR